MAWEDRSERIDHNGARLLWQQVADDLRSEILSGALPADSKLPNELELAAIYGVARVTVRRAIHELRSEGHVVITIGRGTFVAAK